MDFNADTVKKYTNSIKMVLVIVAMVVTSIIIGATYIGLNKIMRSFSKFVEIIKIGSSGKLNRQVDIKSKDEIGEVAKEFNLFMKNLNDVIKDVKRLSENVENENRELFYSIDNIVKGKDSSYKSKDMIENGIIQLNKYVEDVLDNLREQTAAS